MIERELPVLPGRSRALLATLLTATLISACGQGEARLPEAALSSASPVVAEMPAPAVTGDAVFASPEDKAMLLAFHDAASRLAGDETEWTPTECAELSKDLSEVGSPSDVLAATGRVTEPYVQMLWWGERRAAGLALASCAANRKDRTELRADVARTSALVQARLDQMGVTS